MKMSSQNEKKLLLEKLYLKHGNSQNNGSVTTKAQSNFSSEDKSPLLFPNVEGLNKLPLVKRFSNP